MDTSKLKPVTLDVITIIANWALLDKGKITSLEVKNYLRTKGFFATQQIVSEFLEDYQAEIEEEGLLFEIGKDLYTVEVKNVVTNGKTHREYFLSKALVDSDELVDVSSISYAMPANSSVATTISVGKTVSPRDYIAKNMGQSSAQLAYVLGISEASVRAYKANINR